MANDRISFVANEALVLFEASAKLGTFLPLFLNHSCLLIHFVFHNFFVVFLLFFPDIIGQTFDLTLYLSRK